MIINLIPEFLAARASSSRDAAYQAYLDRYRPVLGSYWHNYVLDLDSPHRVEVIARALAANRDDLRRLMAEVDLERMTADVLDRAATILELDQEVDVYLTVGVGAANAAELVVGGRGIVIVCVEHFTGEPNPDTYGLGLSPELLPLWIAHEVAHTVRYTSPTSRSELRRLVVEAGGEYDYWETGSRATLRELLVNEGVAVHAARAAAPGFAEEEYFGFTRRQYRRMRELESFLFRAAEPDLDHSGLGLRLRYLSGGMSPAARLVQGRVLPERCGYYLGARMVEPLVAERGVASAARATTAEFEAATARQAAGRAVGA
jgi:predicted Zn-dependent protease DUF2268